MVCVCVCVCVGGGGGGGGEANKKTKSKCYLLKVLPSMQNVKDTYMHVKGHIKIVVRLLWPRTRRGESSAHVQER